MKQKNQAYIFNIFLLISVGKISVSRIADKINLLVSVCGKSMPKIMDQINIFIPKYLSVYHQFVESIFLNNLKINKYMQINLLAFVYDKSMPRIMDQINIFISKYLSAYQQFVESIFLNNLKINKYAHVLFPILFLLITNFAVKNNDIKLVVMIICIWAIFFTIPIFIMHFSHLEKYKLIFRAEFLKKIHSYKGFLSLAKVSLLGTILCTIIYTACKVLFICFPQCFITTSFADEFLSAILKLSYFYNYLLLFLYVMQGLDLLNKMIFSK